MTVPAYIYRVKHTFNADTFAQQISESEPKKKGGSNDSVNFCRFLFCEDEQGGHTKPIIKAQHPFRSFGGC